MRICHVVGVRPNFMNAAPVIRALAGYRVEQIVVHTGQHYDSNMSEVFFRQLRMSAPDINLQVGSGTHARQTAQIMTHFEPVLQETKPGLVIVYGEVNSTVAAACYRELLGTDGDAIILREEPAWTRAIYHLFIVRVANRDQVIKYLAQTGISTGIHCPIPLHLQKAYQHFRLRGRRLPRHGKSGIRDSFTFDVSRAHCRTANYCCRKTS